jgi:hypothetical protein
MCGGKMRGGIFPDIDQALRQKAVEIFGHIR